MIEKVTGYPDGRICNPVKRLRAQPHLIAVADALRVYEGHALVRKFLVGGETGRRRSARKGSLVNVGWKHAWHVGVNADQFGMPLRGHHVRDDRAPIAALCHESRVSKALHQHGPGTRDLGRVPA